MAKRTRLPRSIRDLVDMDYFEQLTPAEKKWLVRFVDEYYQAAWTTGRGTTDERRASYTRKNQAARDAWLFADLDD